MYPIFFWCWIQAQTFLYTASWARSLERNATNCTFRVRKVLFAKGAKITHHLRTRCLREEIIQYLLRRIILRRINNIWRCPQYQIHYHHVNQVQMFEKFYSIILPNKSLLYVQCYSVDVYFLDGIINELFWNDKLLEQYFPLKSKTIAMADLAQIFHR